MRPKKGIWMKKIGDVLNSHFSDGIFKIIFLSFSYYLQLQITIKMALFADGFFSRSIFLKNNSNNIHASLHLLF